MASNPKARRRTFMAFKAVHAGEGELHALLAALGMTPAEFCRFFDVPPRTFHSWRGHPLHDWPLHLLRWYARARAMAPYLEQRGYDFRLFEAKLVTAQMPTGRYARTPEQFDALFKPPRLKEILCPVHGMQRTPYSVCPMC